MLFFFFCFVLFCFVCLVFFIDCLLVCVFGCLIFSVKVTGKRNKSYAYSRHDICRWLAKKRIATANIHKLIIQCHIFISTIRNLNSSKQTKQKRKQRGKRKNKQLVTVESR